MTQVSFNPTASIEEFAQTRRNSGDSRSTWQISPFDFPRLVTVAYSTCPGCAREASMEFRFHYISDEPKVRKEFLPNGVQLDRGEHSGRIYRLFFPVAGGNESKTSAFQIISQISQTLSGEGTVMRGGQDRARGFRDKAVGAVLSKITSETLTKLGVGCGEFGWPRLVESPNPICEQGWGRNEAG